MRCNRSTKTHTISALAISGFFLLIDVALKHFAYTHQAFTSYVIRPWLGWEYFGNTGIAFNIPLPDVLIFTLTPIVVSAVFIIYKGKQERSLLFSLGTFLLLFGAISNFIDRVALGVTVDYIRIVTSVINVADIMIVIGALLLFTPTSSSSTVDDAKKE